jgi:hypothetical protein
MFPVPTTSIVPVPCMNIHEWIVAVPVTAIVPDPCMNW